MWTEARALALAAAFLAGAATQAERRPLGSVETSGRLAGDPTGWIRAFSTPLPSGAGTIVVVVDVEPLTRPLRLLAAQRERPARYRCRSPHAAGASCR